MLLHNLAEDGRNAAKLLMAARGAARARRASAELGAQTKQLVHAFAALACARGGAAVVNALADHSLPTLAVHLAGAAADAPATRPARRGCRRGGRGGTTRPRPPCAARGAREGVRCLRLIAESAAGGAAAQRLADVPGVVRAPGRGGVRTDEETKQPRASLVAPAVPPRPRPPSLPPRPPAAEEARGDVRILRPRAGRRPRTPPSSMTSLRRARAGRRSTSVACSSPSAWPRCSRASPRSASYSTARPTPTSTTSRFNSTKARRVPTAPSRSSSLNQGARRAVDFAGLADELRAEGTPITHLCGGICASLTSWATARLADRRASWSTCPRTRRELDVDRSTS